MLCSHKRIHVSFLSTANSATVGNGGLQVAAVNYFVLSWEATSGGRYLGGAVGASGALAASRSPAATLNESPLSPPSCQVEYSGNKLWTHAGVGSAAYLGLGSRSSMVTGFTGGVFLNATVDGRGTVVDSRCGKHL